MLPSDIEATLKVRFSTVENAITREELEEDYGITPQSMALDMEAHARGWVCEDAGQIVGFAMGDTDNAEVTVVAVLPSYEGRGIGKTLLGRVQHWLFGEGHEEIWLNANPDPSVRATGFYEKLGWHNTGKLNDEDVVLTRRSD